MLYYKQIEKSTGNTIGVICELVGNGEESETNAQSEIRLEPITKAEFKEFCRETSEEEEPDDDA